MDKGGDLLIVGRFQIDRFRHKNVSFGVSSLTVTVAPARGTTNALAVMSMRTLINYASARRTVDAFVLMDGFLIDSGLVIICFLHI